MEESNNKTTNQGWALTALVDMMTREPIVESITRLCVREATPDIDSMPSDLSDNICDENSSYCACMHKGKNGQSALVANPDGTHTCNIYNETFRMCGTSIKQIETAIDIIISAFQTSKSIYLDAPEELIWEYAEAIKNLKDIPAMLNKSSEIDKKDKEVE